MGRTCESNWQGSGSLGAEPERIPKRLVVDVPSGEGVGETQRSPGPGRARKGQEQECGLHCSPPSYPYWEALEYGLFGRIRPS